MWGFQLWVNLPATDKMTAPRYQDIAPERIPEVRLEDGTSVRIVAGEFGGTQGPVRDVASNPLYLDVHLSVGAQLDVPIAAGHNAFVYVYQGQAGIGDGGAQTLVRGDLGVLDDGTSVSVSAPQSDARLLVVAGKPFGEPVARYGPFVMNTPQQIAQAMEDYRNGRF